MLMGVKGLSIQFGLQGFSCVPAGGFLLVVSLLGAVVLDVVPAGGLMLDGVPAGGCYVRCALPAE